MVQKLAISSETIGVSEETIGFWTNLYPGTIGFSHASFPEMIGSRIEIGRKTCYFFRNDWRFGGNRMVPEMIGARVEIGRKTSDFLRNDWRFGGNRMVPELIDSRVEIG